MYLIKSSLSIILLFAFQCCAFAQDVLFEEYFESGDISFTLNTTDIGSEIGGANSWVVNSGYSGGSATTSCLGIPFTFTLIDTPDQPTGIVNSPQSNYLHIMSSDAFISGFSCASYISADDICTPAGTYFSKMTNDISTSGYESVSFDFYWLCAGGSASYGEIYYSTDGGNSWTILEAFGSQATWTEGSIQNSAFDNQSQLRFGVNFVNGVAFDAADPPFSIDDIIISGTPTGDCTDSFSTLDEETCDSYNSPAGNTYTETGVYTEIIPNAQNCDSIITINLTINDSAEASFDVFDCGLYVSDMGSFYNTSGEYLEFYETANGCDSLVTLNVTVGSEYSFDLDTTTCVEYISPLGISYTESGSFSEMLTTDQGCDSIYNVDVTIVDLEPSIDVVANVLTALPEEAEYQWNVCDVNLIPIEGETNQEFFAIESGSYNVLVTLDGCSALTECVDVIINSVEEDLLEPLKLYPNPSNGPIHIESGFPDTLQLFSSDGKLIRVLDMTTEKIILELPAGIYLLKRLSERSAAAHVFIVK